MITVDGRVVEARGSLLDACRAAGAVLPTFCDDPHLSVRAHCRGCMVEVGGRFAAACSTPARDGLEVRTDTPRLVAYRQDLGEMMRAECDPGGEAARMLTGIGATGGRYPPVRADRPRDASHPYLRLDLDKCILCRRCERACAEVQGQFVYSATGRGARTEITWGHVDFAHTDCTSCGACVQTCPTEAITDVDRLRPGTLLEAPVVRTTCGYCGVGCQLGVHVQEDDVARIDGAEAAVNRGHLCVKGRYAHTFARHPDRLRTPLVRRGGKLVPVEWEEAIRLVAGELTRHRGAVAGLSSSRATNEENYLFQKWMRAGLGTNDVDCCARVCHAPSATGMRLAFGAGSATNSLADIELADLILVVGANVTEAHPVTGARIKQAVLRGARLVVVDPRRTELAAMADVHLQVRPGTNVPLLNSLACVLIREGLVDGAFVAERAEGWDAFAAFAREQTPEHLAAYTGVPASIVRAAARLYGTARRPFMVHGLGVTEHLQGSEGVMLLCNLAVLAGAVGRPGVGVNPLRGQNNVQGSADMGVSPDFLAGYQPVADPAVRARFEAIWGRRIPATPGRTIPRMYEAIHAGDVRALFVFGEDVAQTDPDSADVRRALERVDFLVVQELFLSETAAYADVVLPGASFLEKDGTFTNGERRVQRVRRALPPLAGRADWETLLALMAATGLPQTFRHPSEVMDEIAAVAPSFAGLDYHRLDGDGLQWPVPYRGHPGTAVLHADGFLRGRAKLAVVEWTPSPAMAPGLWLTTGRALVHYNAGSMTRRTANRAIVDHDALEVHPIDAEAHGIADGDAVEVESENGTARAIARVTDRVAPGTLFLTFHFPETHTNALTGHVRDRLSDCPEYKITAVRIRRAGA